MAHARTPMGAALWASAIVAALLGGLLLSGILEPVDLIQPARTGQGSEVVLEDFGAEGIRAADPFDGQYIYVTARLLPDWEAISDQIYEADYRLVRIVHPLLASPAPAGAAMVLLLVFWNIVGLAMLTFAFADILCRAGHERSWIVGAAVAACALALLLTTSEPLAFGLGMLGLCLVDRGRLAWAVPVFALGGLTRESALTFAAAAAVLAWTRRERVGAVLMFAASVVPTALWWAYVQSVTPASRVPLAPLGILHLGERWSVDIATTVLALGLMAVSVAAWWDVPPLRWLALAFVAWLPFYEEFAFKLVGLPRISLPSIALGLAGLARWRNESRAPVTPPEARSPTLVT